VQGFTEPEVVKGVALGEGSSKQQQGGGMLAQLMQQLEELLRRGAQDPFYAVLAYRETRPSQ
jgi:hypothetical protein